MQSDGLPATRATLDALTRFLAARLVKPAPFAGDTVRAFAETAERFNDTHWFWTDDNAKAAELFCEPACYDADPGPAEAALAFVLRMSEGAVMQRRGGPAEIRLVSADPAAFRVETAFFIVEGDLTRGVVRHALRFNDNRTVTAADHAGGVARVVLAGRRLDTGETVDDHGVEMDGRGVTLRHGGPVRAPDGTPLGRLTHRYRVDADSPSLSLAVSLRAEPGVTLHDVVLTTALARMAASRGVRYRALSVSAGGRDTLVRAAPLQLRPLHHGPADYAAAVQEGGAPGFNYALHMLLPDGARLREIAGAGRGGRLRRLVNRYAVGTVADGATATVREERMLTGGGYYDVPGHYADVLRRAPGGGEADPSMSYDIGAELNAVAVHILFARAGRYAVPPSPDRLAALEAWYDRHVERYFAFVRPEAPDALARVFTRGIAFVVMSLDCMVRARGAARDRERLRTGVALILRLARRRPLLRDRLTFGDEWSPLGRFLDCHAACILALARASRHGDAEGTLGRAIHAAVRGIRFYRGTVRLGPTERVPYDGLAVHNRRRFDTYVDTGFWTFKLGLVLRALHAVERAVRDGHIGASAAESADVAVRRRRAESLLAPCCRWHGNLLEVLTSPLAGETNSETQPWVALGLVPRVDETIEDCRVPGTPAG